MRWRRVGIFCEIFQTKSKSNGPFLDFLSDSPWEEKTNHLKLCLPLIDNKQTCLGSIQLGSHPHKLLCLLFDAVSVSRWCMASKFSLYFIPFLVDIKLLVYGTQGPMPHVSPQNSSTNLSTSVWLGRAIRGPPTTKLSSSPAGLLINQFGPTFPSNSAQFWYIFQTPVKEISGTPRIQCTKLVEEDPQLPKLMHFSISLPKKTPHLAVQTSPIPSKPCFFCFTPIIQIISWSWTRGHKCKRGHHRYSWKSKGLVCLETNIKFGAGWCRWEWVKA